MDEPTDRAPVVLIMGVSGSGKTTIGTALSERTGWPFQDADLLHPPENVTKMRAGIELTDSDRWPWLHRVTEWIAGRHEAGGGGIVACSALKRRYRDLLRTADPQLRLVYLHGTAALLADRIGARRGHFFPANLLSSQLHELEEPDPDEHAITVSIGQSPQVTVDTVLAAWGVGRNG